MGLDFFIHIPKTAGMTLMQILHREYHESGWLWIQPETRLEDAKRLLMNQRGKPFKLAHGHVPFGIHEAVIEPVRYFTMLRDPIERAISHYYFVRRTPGHRLYRDVVREGMTLFDYATSGITGELANGQAAMIAGLEGDVPSSDRAILQRAQANIESSFAAVGLAEDFDRSIIVLKLALGWTKPLVYERKNVTAGRQSIFEVPRKTREAIAAQNELDEALYLFVRERLDAQIGDQATAVRRELLKLRIENALYRHIPRSALRLGWDHVQRLSSSDRVRE